MKHKTYNRGFTLLETFVAVTIFIFAIIGPLELASRSIGSAIIFQNQLTAFYLGQEAMEFIRNKRDSNLFQGQDWLYGLNDCITPNSCYVDIINNGIVNSCPDPCRFIKYDVTNGYNYVDGYDTIFIRSIKITNPVGSNDDEAKIETTMSWEEKSGTKNFVLEEYIFNWK
jgi:type II secretory pathway pseudopilin PulG